MLVYNSMDLQLSMKWKRRDPGSVPVSSERECEILLRPPTNSNFFFPETFNRLIAVFGFASMGRLEWVKYYFKTIGSLAVLFIETTPEIGSGKECLDAIAQVIAECDR
jgi:hypothetical protein